MYQNVFYLVCLLDLDTYADAVDAWFDKDLLVFISGDDQWIEKDLERAGGFDFRNVVPLRRLRRKV